MSKKIIQYIVIILAILIILCFIALIVGVYLKISGNQNNSDYNTIEYSLNLAEDEKIIDMQVLNNNEILILISNSMNTYGIVYDTNKKSKISLIKR